MSQSDLRELLSDVGGVCFKCFLMIMGVLVVWFAAFTQAGDWAWEFQSRWFHELSKPEFVQINYYGMTFLKLFAFLFFFFPWLAIRWQLARKQSVTEV